MAPHHASATSSVTDGVDSGFNKPGRERNIEDVAVRDVNVPEKNRVPLPTENSSNAEIMDLPNMEGPPPVFGFSGPYKASAPAADRPVDVDVNPDKLPTPHVIGPDDVYYPDPRPRVRRYDVASLDQLRACFLGWKAFTEARKSRARLAVTIRAISRRRILGNFFRLWKLRFERPSVFTTDYTSTRVGWSCGLCF